jgi:hypothetical protein
MSPTIFRQEGFTFLFFSREETRMHVHVRHANGEAKFWLEPTLEVATCWGLSSRLVNKAMKLVMENEDEIRAAWQRHFAG